MSEWERAPSLEPRASSLDYDYDYDYDDDYDYDYEHEHEDEPEGGTEKPSGYEITDLVRHVVQEHAPDGRAGGSRWFLYWLNINRLIDISRLKHRLAR